MVLFNNKRCFDMAATSKSSKKNKEKQEKKENVAVEQEENSQQEEKKSGQKTKSKPTSKKDVPEKEKKEKEAGSSGKQTEENSLEDELNELKDKYLRLSAEFDNYRKRTLKEKMEMSKSAGEDLIVKLLPVMDDFERGLSQMNEAKDVKAVQEGVKLIYSKFRETLVQKGLKEIEAKEKEFDTELHEAVTKIPAPSEDMKGMIIDVVEKGYYLNEKIIRFPKVVVGD